jgi:hypothetical protein
MSPYRALYGRECTQVNKMLVADVLEENMDLDSYVSDLALTMIAVWESLGVTIFETSIKRQSQHVRRNGEQFIHTYKEGDMVLIKKIPAATFVSEVTVDKKKQRHKIRAALQNRYKGPFVVVGVISANTIVCMVNGKEQHIAYQNLKPYHPKDIAILRKIAVSSVSFNLEEGVEGEGVEPAEYSEY